MVLYLLFVLCVTGPEPLDIARVAVSNYQADQKAALRYTYTENDDDQNKGPVVYQISTIGGTPYERVVSRNGKRLAGDEDARERQKFEKTIAERANESTSSRDKRLKNFEEQTRFLEEAPGAFDFKMLPEVILDGRETILVECTPKPGFQPHSTRSKMFTKVQAKAWVDKRDLRIVKVQADITDPVSIGWIMARVGRGTHMEMEQMRLHDGSWVMKRLCIDGKAKILLVDNKNWDETVVYSDYRESNGTAAGLAGKLEK